MPTSPAKPHPADPEGPADIATAMTGLFAIGGRICAGDGAAGSRCGVTINPESGMSRSSRCGARLLAWADGALRWLDGGPRGDLHGW